MKKSWHLFRWKLFGRIPQILLPLLKPVLQYFASPISFAEFGSEIDYFPLKIPWNRSKIDEFWSQIQKYWLIKWFNLQEIWICWSSNDWAMCVRKLLLCPVCALVWSASYHISPSKSMCVNMPYWVASLRNIILLQSFWSHPTSDTWWWWFLMQFLLTEARGLIKGEEQYHMIQFCKWIYLHVVSSNNHIKG